MADGAHEAWRHDAKALAAAMDAQGYAAIPNFVSDDALRGMQSFVHDAVQKNGGEYVAFSGPDQLTGSGLDTLGASSAFRTLMEQIYEAGTGRPAPNQAFHEVLRCLAGTGSLKNSYLFHYDSFVVTALVPIVVPTSGLSGDLLMLPNTRPIRSQYLFNVIDKLILDNRLSQRVLKWLTLRGKLPLTRIKMVPGTMYFFWGYRSIHTNEPCDPSKVRSTALFHYANPHRSVPARAPVPSRTLTMPDSVAAGV